MFVNFKQRRVAHGQSVGCDQSSLRRGDTTTGDILATLPSSADVSGAMRLASDSNVDLNHAAVTSATL
jgi:hypothetical protein